MEIFLIFTVPAVAYGLSIFWGTWSLRMFAGMPDYGILTPSWSRAFYIAIVAETCSFVLLYISLWLLNYWGYYLPSKPSQYWFFSVEILFVWMVSTCLANATEIFVMRSWFGIYPNFALVSALSLCNALCSWPEIAHQFKFIG